MKLKSKNKYIPAKKSLERFRADYYKQKSEMVIQKDLQYVYSFLGIELYENHGFDTEKLADFFAAVQQRWIEYSKSDQSETPMEMLEKITGVQLLS